HFDRVGFFRCFAFHVRLLDNTFGRFAKSRVGSAHHFYINAANRRRAAATVLCALAFSIFSALSARGFCGGMRAASAGGHVGLGSASPLSVRGSFTVKCGWGDLAVL